MSVHFNSIYSIHVSGETAMKVEHICLYDKITLMCKMFCTDIRLLSLQSSTAALQLEISISSLGIISFLDHERKMNN